MEDIVLQDLLDFIAYASKTCESMSKSTPIEVSTNFIDGLSNEDKYICAVISVQTKEAPYSSIFTDSVENAMYLAGLYYDALLAEGYTNITFEPQYRWIQ